MPDIKQTLKLKSDPSTNVYPNIVSDNIPSKAVTDDKIDDNAVTAAQLADNAVTENKILDEAVTKFKIADGAVTNAKIDGDAITSDKISNGAVTAAKIANGAVTFYKIPSNTIDRSKIRFVIATGPGIVIQYPTLSDFSTFHALNRRYLRFFVLENEALLSEYQGTFCISYYNIQTSAWVHLTFSNDTEYANIMGAEGITYVMIGAV